MLPIINIIKINQKTLYFHHRNYLKLNLFSFISYIYFISILSIWFILFQSFFLFLHVWLWNQGEYYTIIVSSFIYHTIIISSFIIIPHIYYNTTLILLHIYITIFFSYFWKTNIQFNLFVPIRTSQLIPKCKIKMYMR